MLKKPILLATALFAVAGLFGQGIKNGSFENWDSVQYEAPAGWYNYNTYSLSFHRNPSVTKVPGHQGSGIKLEVIDDIDYGYVGGISNLNDDIFSGHGGAAYSQQPTHITGYYKAAFQMDDSAVLGVLFLKAGSIISSDQFKIGEDQSSFTQFSFPLSLNTVPDSVVVYAMSSDIDAHDPYIGSYIILDELSFSGPGITQPLPGGDFENWGNEYFETPDDWSRSEEGVFLTTDAQEGNSAVLLESTIQVGELLPARISNGNPSNMYSSTGGGIPITQDTLVFYYKYFPVNNDSAMIWFRYSNAGSVQLYDWKKYIHAASGYTRVEMPIPQSIQVVDTVRIDFYSSSLNSDERNAGSKLYLDNAFLKSGTPLFTPRVSQATQKLTAYPNPAYTEINIAFTANESFNGQINIIDVSGKTLGIHTVAVVQGQNLITLPVDALQQGVYFYQLVNTQTGAQSNGRFIKQ